MWDQWTHDEIYHFDPAKVDRMPERTRAPRYCAQCHKSLTGNEMALYDRHGNKYHAQCYGEIDLNDRGISPVWGSLEDPGEELGIES
jgi:hypothetical protein